MSKPKITLLFVALLISLWSIPSPPANRLAQLAVAPLLSESPESPTSSGSVTLRESVHRDISRANGTLSLAPFAPGLERSILADLRASAPSPFTVERSLEGATFKLKIMPASSASAASQVHLTYARSTTSHQTVTAPFAPPKKTSLLPPLLAIAAAVLFRRTATALFLGVLIGAILLRLDATGAFGITLIPQAFLDVFRIFLWERLGDPDNTRTIIFVVLMLSMVGLMVRSGGLTGVMDGIASRAKSARGAQIATWLMGLCVFFDDYSNTVLVGSTMRPLTDRFRVAREKLAYIVDSTAAPVAGLSLFSTWIAFEVTTFAPQLPAAGIPADQGYAIFLETLPFRFYSILTLFFVGLVVITGRDFGPMRKAEMRARRGELLAPGSTPMQGAKSTNIAAADGVTPKAAHALIPLFAFVLTTLAAILYRGGALELAAGFQAETSSLAGLTEASLAPFSIMDGLRSLFTFEGLGRLCNFEAISSVLLNGSGTTPLLIGSTTGFTLAAIGCARAGIARQIPAASLSVLTSMFTAFAILYLAWMIGSVCREMQTANYLTALFADGIPPLLLPTILFLLASAIAFATGSSWSTMMILLPLVVALAFDLGETTHLGGRIMVLMSIGAVLEGSIFGDHCSPLSDTTVLSSISSASDHIDHVRTQTPYALATMAAAIVCGYLPCAYFGTSPYLGLGLGAAALATGLFWFGGRGESVQFGQAGDDLSQPKADRRD